MGIIQHKAMHELAAGVQQELLDQPATSTAGSTLSQELSARLASDSAVMDMLRSAAATNPYLYALLQADTSEVKALAARPVEEARQEALSWIHSIVMLLELLSPARYPKSLWKATPQPQHSQQQPGSRSPAGTQSPATGSHSSSELSQAQSANGHELQEQSTTEAATQLLTHLQEYQAVIDRAVLVAAVILAHAPNTAFELTAMNLTTGQPSTPPTGHFLQAARRLQLTPHQVRHLRLILKQYNRMARQRAQAGQQLVDLSADSLTLQAQASLGRDARGDADGACAPPVGGQPDNASAGCGSSGQPAAAQCGTQQQSPPAGGSPGPSQPESQDSQDAQDDSGEQAALEKLLQQHMSSTLNMHLLVATWTITTLSPYQCGEFMVACYPYYPYVQALIEVSPFLQPHEGPPVLVDASACSEAARAAELAEQLGYGGAHAYMERRCSLLVKQVESALAEAQQTMGTSDGVQQIEVLCALWRQRSSDAHLSAQCS